MKCEYKLGVDQHIDIEWLHVLGRVGIVVDGGIANEKVGAVLLKLLTCVIHLNIFDGEWMNSKDLRTVIILRKSAVGTNTSFANEHANLRTRATRARRRSAQ